MFYSAQTGGFYTKEIHGENIPTDVVEITAQEYRALIDGQVGGKRIITDGAGRPMLAEPAPLTADELLAQAKAARTAAVAAIKVTVGGVEFDGDEVAQGRMARAALTMSDADTLPWVIADGTVVTVTKSELLEVLRQAGAAMAAIWVRPYL